MTRRYVAVTGKMLAQGINIASSCGSEIYSSIIHKGTQKIE